MSRSLVLATVILVVVGAILVAPRANAADQVTVPTVAGQVVTVTWQGTILPGVHTGSECGSDVTVDTHQVLLAVPLGAYATVTVQATVTITYSGPTDVIVTAAFPDGTTLSGDQGFVDADESVGFANPAAGLYEFRACAFLGAVPQPYTGTLTLEATTQPLAAVRSCPAPKSLSFTAPSYVDTERAGGEPSVVAHPDGTLLYAAHAGTTHFYSPDAPEGTEAFWEHYRGQVHSWYSTDSGASWHFVDRTLPPDNIPFSGFSDPDFAIDTKGNVYLSEINLANVSVSGSADSGKTYTSRSFFAMTITDRQWSAGGPENVVFLVGNADEGGTVPGDPVGNNGHLIYRSVDGGRTFSDAVEDPGGLGDLVFDQAHGTLYEAHYEGGALMIAAFRNALNADPGKALTPEKHTIARGVQLLSHWPAIDVDSAGNLYIAWDEHGAGDDPLRAAGIWYSYSRDAGNTWAAPVRVDTDARTDIWPWIAVGDPGRVAVAWFGNDIALPDNDAERAGPNDGWNVYVAQTTTGLGCQRNGGPAFRVTKATLQPFHMGTICMGGTTCQATLTDRRLGDYFTIDVDTSGALVAAYSDTRQGGAVALPAFFRQTGGTSFLATKR